MHAPAVQNSSVTVLFQDLFHKLVIIRIAKSKITLEAFSFLPIYFMSISLDRTSLGSTGIYLQMPLLKQEQWHLR